MVSRVTGPSANSPYRILRVSVTGSTNADLLARARGGEPAGLVLVADHQTTGRGRLDRRWLAPPGTNLLASILLRPTRPAEQWFRATMAVAVATVDACRARGVAASIKWPNDVLVATDKLAGILAETDGAGAVVVGIGCNIAWPMTGELAGATSLAAHGVAVSPLVFADEILAGFDDDAPDLLDRYRARCSTIGRDVRVDLPGGAVVQGRAVGVDDDGLLVVEVASAGADHPAADHSAADHSAADHPGAGPAFVTRRFAVGDVVHAHSG